MAQKVLSDFTNASGVSYFIQRGQVTVNFGALPGNYFTAKTTVSATWVAAGSIITLAVAAVQTADHTPDEVIAEGVVAYVTNLVVGVSFDIVLNAPKGTYGAYLVNYLGG